MDRLFPRPSVRERGVLPHPDRKPVEADWTVDVIGCGRADEKEREEGGERKVVGVEGVGRGGAIEQGRNPARLDKACASCAVHKAKEQR